MILLVILTILVLFTLVAVTFVLVATQEYKTARADWKSQLYDDEFDEHLERVMLQVVRGSNVPTSRIGFHSLLEDMYGSDGVVDYLATDTPPVTDPPLIADAFFGFSSGNFLGGGSLIYAALPLTGPDRIAGNGDDYRITAGYYNGRVMTMLGGPAAGKSTRVLGYGAWDGEPFIDLDGDGVFDSGTEQYSDLDASGSYDGPDGTLDYGILVMQPFDGMFIDTLTGVWATTTAPQDGDAFFINGRPYNGSGAGYNSGEPFTDSNGNGVYDAAPIPEPYVDTDGDGVYDAPTGLVDATEPPSAGGRQFALLPFRPHPFDAIHHPPYFVHMCGADGQPGAAGVNDDVATGNTIIDDVGELGWPGSDDNFQFDEDYDAVDYQNMIMAARMWNPTAGANRWEVVLPSLVRPDLVRYWINRYVTVGPNGIAGDGDDGFDFFDTSAANLDQIAELFTRIYPRPLQLVQLETSPYGHPNFDGNPLLNLDLANATDNWPGGLPPGNGIPDSIDGLYADFTGDGFPDTVYDVDNDGDGRPDSVWADVGLPVQTLPDGRIVKPLAAIMVLDMDGRLNLNGQGNVAHYAVDTSTTEGEVYVAQNIFSGPYAFDPSGTADDTLIRPIGSGYSVADVNLAFGLPTPYLGSFPDYLAAFGTSNTINEYRQLLQGRPPLDLDGDGAADVPAIPGRYGEPHLYFDPDVSSAPIGEYLFPIAGGNATSDWVSRYLAAGWQLPMPGITSTGVIPGADGWDLTAGTGDDYWDGDDNVPAAPVSGVPTGFVHHWRGNQYGESFLPGFPIGHYGVPGDPNDNGGLLLDVRGQPYYSQMGERTIVPGITLPEGVDEHAELDLSQSATRKFPAFGSPAPAFGTTHQVDQPFTPGELEYLLRYFDIDARSLPNRIGRLAPLTVGNNQARGRLTTESWDYAGPSIAPTPELRDLLLSVGASPTNVHLQDLVAIRLLEAGIPVAEVNANLTILLSQDSSGGLRLDLNRPLGNGLSDDSPAGLGVFDAADDAFLDVDNDGSWSSGDGYTDDNQNGLWDPGETYTDDDTNGAYTPPEPWVDLGDFVVDDPDEATQTDGSGNPLETLWNGSAAGAISFDHNNDGLFDENDMLARQNLARHIYVLMMLLKDRGYVFPMFQTGLANTAPGGPGTLVNEGEELTAARIAQWAINVVDFRDRDSIMTGFEYDVRPFEDGNTTADDIAWDVDGWIGHNPLTGIADNDTTTNPHRRVVWGCEYPDLVITETTAGHDRRVVDTATEQPTDADNDGMLDPVELVVDGDGDFDQERIPQGWAFIELYCTRNPNNLAFQGDLYNFAHQLDLGRMAPDDSDGDAYPVWRLAVTHSRFDGAGGDSEYDVWRRAYGDSGETDPPNFEPDTLTFQPERLNALELAAPLDNVPIERVVWFAAQAPTNNATVVPRDQGKQDENDKVFYNGAANDPSGFSSPVLLNPGQYAVVGPRRHTLTPTDNNVTVIGYQVAADPEPQRFRLGNSFPVVPFLFTDNEAPDVYTYPYPSVVGGTLPDIKQPLGIAVGGDRAGWTNSIGFSISEPLFSGTDDPMDPNDWDYYPLPTAGPAGSTEVNTTDPHNGALVWNDRYDLDGNSANMVRMGYDEPLDNTRNLGAEDLLDTNTVPRYKTVFLQRLANPVSPWNPAPGHDAYNSALPVNPYLTVDWMPIDLTVYNGEADPSDAEPDPDDDTSSASRNTDVDFASRQRGENDDTPDNFLEDNDRRGDGTSNLWSPISANPERVTDPAYGFTNPNQAGIHNLRHLLDHTLGYLNMPYHDYTAAAPYYGATAPYAGAAIDRFTPSISQYVGDPVRPFSWLTWNNRPYASAMELLMVPSSSPQRLLYEHDIRRTNFAEHYRDRWDSGDNVPDDGPPYGHLLNLLYSGDINDDFAADPKTWNATAPLDDGSTSNFHRLFELVTVPSRMSGTEEMLEPVAFTGIVGADFHPPFNRLSRYRDPGKLNLNTMFDDGAILRGLTNDIGNSGGSNVSLWEKFSRSRRGYGPAAAAGSPPDPMLYLDDSPTVFANPLRSFGSDYNVPLPALRYRNVDTSDEPRQYVESGLLRPDPDDDNRPLFAPDAALGDDGWTDSAWTEEYRNANNNPYFRYQLLQKMGNTVTTRSHVYAIWITVGYFEAERVAPSAQHPEGFRYGREVGADTGEIGRHRAFYLFDRSIPVAFQRGQNHNVHRAILIDRVIE